MMLKALEKSGKTEEAAIAAALEELGLDRDDVSVEIVERAKSGFLGIGASPAVVRVQYEAPDEEPETVAEAPAAAPAEAQAQPAAAPAAPAAAADEPESYARIRAFVSGLLEHMGIQAEIEITARENGGVNVNLSGSNMGAVIGRRGETMESLSYLASLVANRLEGDYIKLGLDVAGYRDKRESDLTALAQRIGAKVRKTGRSFAMEPMNPYERRIIHSAISKMEGVRSESKGEGRDRRVVIYSTAPDAQTENTYGERRGRGGNRNGRRPGGSRNGGYRGGNRSEHGDHNGNRGGYRGSRNGAPRGPRPSGVPERTYAPRDAENAAPVAPKRTERVDDFADFSFGKIEL